MSFAPMSRYPTFRDDRRGLLGHLAFGHLRPVPIHNGFSIGTRQSLQLFTLWFREPFRETIEVHHGMCLKIDIEVGVAQTRPHCVEHKAKNDSVCRAQNAELP